MQGLKDWWNGVLAIEGAEWIIYPSVLIVLVLFAYYVVQAFRNMAIGGSAASDDHLGTFRKMRDEGMIAPEEYTKVAGLVPLPETDSAAKAAPDAMSGAGALSEAAKAALKKAALKNSDDSLNADEDLESGQDEESEES